MDNIDQFSDQFIEDVKSRTKLVLEKIEPIINEFTLISIKIKQLNLKGFTIEDRPMNPQLRELYMLQSDVKDSLFEAIEN